MFNLTSPDIMLSSFLWIDVFVSSWLIILILHFCFVKLKPFFCIVCILHVVLMFLLWSKMTWIITCN
jgi:hypothetical protein